MRPPIYGWPRALSDAPETVGNNLSCFFEPFPRSADPIEIGDNAFKRLRIDRLITFGGFLAKKRKNNSTDQLFLLKKLSESGGGHVNVNGKESTDLLRVECRDCGKAIAEIV